MELQLQNGHTIFVKEGSADHAVPQVTRIDNVEIWMVSVNAYYTENDFIVRADNEEHAREIARRLTESDGR